MAGHVMPSPSFQPYATKAEWMETIANHPKRPSYESSRTEGEVKYLIDQCLRANEQMLDSNYCRLFER